MRSCVVGAARARRRLSILQEHRQLSHAAREGERGYALEHGGVGPVVDAAADEVHGGRGDGAYPGDVERRRLRVEEVLRYERDAAGGDERRVRFIAELRAT